MLETKINVKKTALLVIDMQNDLIKAKEEPFSTVTKMVKSKGVISNTAKVIEAARQARMPIIFIGHVHRKDNADAFATITDLMLQGLAPPPREALVEGTPGAYFVDELKPLPGDHIVWKRRSNAFYNSDLELMLRRRGIDTVIITGVVTNGCVANTVRGAQERDLHVIVLSDCCAAMMPEDDEYFIKNAFPRAGRVRTSDEMVTVISGANA
jgi:nicotinamidase-related amidase